MDTIVIEGGARLRGEVRVSGAKNAALPLLAAALLSDGPTTLENVPEVADVETMAALLRHLGARVERGPGTLTVDATDAARPEAPWELVSRMRASVLVLGPLVARHGRATVSLPGGCAIGARPIDQHLRGLEAMGAKVQIEHGNVVARAPRGGLVGTVVTLDVPTVTGTENLMMAAVRARGRTVLENAAREPEVEELARALVKMGARIQGAGTRVITVEGVERLAGTVHALPPDRIEAGTLLVAGAMTRGEVLVAGCDAELLEAPIAKLRGAGAEVEVEAGGLRVRGPRELQPVDITTQPYPGFPTDLQAQFLALAACAPGQSVITETIFESRSHHVQELARMGADVHADGRTTIVRGVRRLQGARVTAADLRASAALVLAGLVAEGTTTVAAVEHLDRGYERLDEKLAALGARIRRVRPEAAS